MAGSSNLAMKIALVLSAETAAASKAFTEFSEETAKKINDLQKKANLYNKIGTKASMYGMTLLAPIKSAVSSASDLQTEVQKIAEITGDKIGTEGFSELEKSAINIGKHMNRDATEATKLMSILADRVPKENLEAVGKEVGVISRAFRMAPEEAATAFNSLIDRFKLTEKEAISTFDNVAAITAKFGGSNTNILSLLDSGGAAQAKQLGFEANEIIALGNAFNKVGADAGQVQRNILRLTNAVRKEGKIKETFEGAGGGVDGFIAVMQRAKDSGDAVRWLQMGGIGGRAAAYYAELAERMEDSAGLLDQTEFIRNNANAQGAALGLMEDQNKSFGELLLKLKNDFNSVTEEIGLELIPIISKFLETIQPIISSVSTWIKENQKLTMVIVSLVGAIGGALMAVGVIGKLAAAFLNLHRVFVIVSNFSKLLSFNPIILIVGVIIGLVYLIITNWDKIKVFFENLWASIKIIFSKTMQWINNLFVKYNPKTLILNSWSKTSAFFSNLWNTIKDIFLNTWEWIKELFFNYHPLGLIIEHWETIIDFFVGLWDKVKSIFSTTWDWIKEKVLGVWNSIKSIIPNWVQELFGGSSSSNHNFNFDSNPGNLSPSGISEPSRSPSPIPLASTSTNSMNFAPVLNISGSMDEDTANKVTAQLRRDFERQMKDYEYNKNRKSLT